MNFFDSQGQKQSFEERVSQNTAQNNSGQNALSALLPLLSGGQIDAKQIFEMLAKNNPNLGGIMPLLPMLQAQNFAPAKEKSCKFNYVKVNDYHKNQKV